MAVAHYCTLADVNRHVPQAPFTATSRPTADDVTEIIEVKAIEMDAVLANLGYVTPVIEGDLSLKLLREHCAYGALAIAQSGRGEQVVDSVHGTEVRSIWERRFTAFLDRLADDEDPLELPDAPRTDEEVVKDVDDQVRSHVESLSSAEFDPDDSPVTRDQRF